MERGDLAARAPLERSSSPELRRLAASFNGMANSLQTRQAERQASEARLRAIVDTAADGIVTINQQGVIEFVNPAVERLFGYRRDELTGQNVSMLMTTPDREQHDHYLARYLRTGEARIIGIGREVTGRRKDGSEVPLFLSIGEFRLEGQRLFTGILRNISERKRSDERQLLLMAEIDHRAKNLLASIQAMVLLTKPHARSVSDYADTLIGRLHAMARAHDLLAREEWQGARLHDLIRNEFEAYVSTDGAALAISGDDLLLRPRPAQALSLALHELTTNAAKYGALSVPGGRVTIRSSVERTAAEPTFQLDLDQVRRAGGRAARAARLRQRRDRARHRPRSGRQHAARVRPGRASLQDLLPFGLRVRQARPVPQEALRAQEAEGRCHRRESCSSRLTSWARSGCGCCSTTRATGSTASPPGPTRRWCWSSAMARVSRSST